MSTKSHFSQDSRHVDHEPFLGDVQNLDIDWPFLLIFTGISIIGIFIGIWLNKFIDGKKLKKGFGWFVLVMGIYIIYKEIAKQ